MANEEKNSNENEEECEVYTLTDENGNEAEYEVLAGCELDGHEYFALLPQDSEEYVILKKEREEDGEDILVTIDDDDEFDRVADVFEDQFNEIDCDAQEDK